MGKTPFLLVAFICLSCSEPSIVVNEDIVTLIGSWQLLSETHTACTDSGAENTENCAGSPMDCGILTFTETSWSLVKTGAHGAQVSQGGGYDLSGNTINFSGGGPGYNSPTFTLSGSAITYTSTLLTFITFDYTTGCSIKILYSRYGKPSGPSS